MGCAKVSETVRALESPVVALVLFPLNLRNLMVYCPGPAYPLLSELFLTFNLLDQPPETGTKLKSFDFSSSVEAGVLK